MEHLIGIILIILIGIICLLGKCVINDLNDLKKEKSKYRKQ